MRTMAAVQNTKNTRHTRRCDFRDRDLPRRPFREITSALREAAPLSRQSPLCLPQTTPGAPHETHQQANTHTKAHAREAELRVGCTQARTLEQTLNGNRNRRDACPWSGRTELTISGPQRQTSLRPGPGRRDGKPSSSNPFLALSLSLFLELFLVSLHLAFVPTTWP